MKEHILVDEVEHFHDSSYYYDNNLDCISCGCYRNGTEDDICDAVTGKCYCKEGFAGQLCNKFRKIGMYQYSYQPLQKVI